MPAAVPLTEATTGFWQSSTEAMRRWVPSAIVRMIDPVRGTVPSSASSEVASGARRSAPVQKCFAGRAQDDGADPDVDVGRVHQVAERIALVGRQGITSLGPVQRDPGDASFEAVEHGATDDAVGGAHGRTHCALTKDLARSRRSGLRILPVEVVGRLSMRWT